MSSGLGLGIPYFFYRPCQDDEFANRAILVITAMYVVDITLTPWGATR
jgi:hypothetical protein